MVTVRLAAACVALLLASAPVSAQGNYVNIGGGSVELRVSSAIAGGEPIPAVSSSTVLSWSFTANNRDKIIVSTSAPGQRFTLRVAALNVQGAGVAQPEVTLTHGMLPADLIREITRRRPGSATLRYTAQPTAAQGNSGPGAGDFHTVTYTVTSQ